MKKINGFSITRLTLSGFKCYKDTTIFDFGDTTFITASNGQGKSSIADAIAFAFVGTPFFGDKGLDRLQNKFSQEMMVGVDFVDDNGENHNLTRSRKRDATSITYDGITVRQSDLNEAFGGKDVFLSILNPLYFVDVLGDGGKGLLEKLLPMVNHEDVLAALPSSTREILADQPLTSPETYIKNRRSELRKLDEELISYRGQQELLEYQREERKTKISELRAAVDGITREMEELEEIRDNGIDRAAEEAKLAELREKRSQLLTEGTGSGDKALREVMDEIKAIEKSITKNTAKQYKSNYTGQIAEAEVKLKALYAEHAKLSKTLENTVVGYQCPVCATVITEKNVGTVRRDIQKQLTSLVDEGKKAKAELANVIALDNEARAEFEKQKAEAIRQENNRLDELNQRLQEINVALEIDKEDFSECLSILEEQIKEQETRIDYGNWIEEQTAYFQELKENKKSLEAQIQAISNTEDYDYTNVISETEDEVARLKRLINEAIQYMAKRIELMLDGLKMTNTEIVLTEIVKTTGEVKDCFRFSYEGRDYKCLSLSEKVRAGLDVAVLMQKLSGRNYPIFIDNGESICTFGKVRPEGQVIIARVVNNQALQMTHRNREQKTAA